MRCSGQRENSYFHAREEKALLEISVKDNQHSMTPNLKRFLLFQSYINRDQYF